MDTDGRREESIFTLLKCSHHSLNSLRSPKDNSVHLLICVSSGFLRGLIESFWLSARHLAPPNLNPASFERPSPLGAEFVRTVPPTACISRASRTCFHCARA